MQNGNKIQIGPATHDIDWRHASRSIRVLTGRVVVEMLPLPEKVGAILLPPTVAANLRSDMGVVISSPGSWRGGTWIRRSMATKFGRIFYPAPGEVVCVRPANGTWLEEADMGGYKPANQVRVYGVFCKFTGTPIREPWWDSIVCRADMKPYGDNILIRLDPVVEEGSGKILLADEAQYRTGMATVLAVGKLVKDIRRGDRVSVDIHALKSPAVAGLQFDFSEDAKSLWICTEEAFNWINLPVAA